jgi:hypothetical protein
MALSRSLIKQACCSAAIKCACDERKCAVETGEKRKAEPRVKSTNLNRIVHVLLSCEAMVTLAEVSNLECHLTPATPAARTQTKGVRP